MKLWGIGSPGASLMGLTAPSAAGKGLIENSLFRSAAGVSGNVPGSPSGFSASLFFSKGASFANPAVVDSGAAELSVCNGSAFFSFSRGTSLASAAVVDSGAAELMMCVVAGTLEMILSGVKTLFSLPDSSASLETISKG